MALKIYDTVEPQGNYPAAMAKDVAMEVRSGEATLEPGIYYQFGEVSELTVELADGYRNSASEYVFEFTPLDGFSFPTITPDVIWMGSPQFPVGKQCIVSICMGLAVTGYSDGAGASGGGGIDHKAIKEAVDKYLEENPPAQGEPGKDGYTPVKGEDYFTPEEIQEIAEQAAQMVEVPTGEDRVLLADFTAEEDVTSPVIPLADNVCNYKSILIYATIKCSGQLWLSMTKRTNTADFVTIVHQNTHLSDSSFKTLACKIDFYHSYFFSTYTVLQSYQWQTSAQYTYSNNFNRTKIFDSLSLGCTVYTGTRIIVEGVK